MTQSIPTYTGFFQFASVVVWKKRGAAVRNFQQKIDAANGRYVAWKTWDLICQPKKNGGLAIKDLWKKKLRLCF